jgi:hypothetical protein
MPQRFEPLPPIAGSPNPVNLEGPNPFSGIWRYSSPQQPGAEPTEIYWLRLGGTRGKPTMEKISFSVLYPNILELRFQEILVSDRSLNFQLVAPNGDVAQFSFLKDSEDRLAGGIPRRLSDGSPLTPGRRFMDRIPPEKIPLALDRLEVQLKLAAKTSEQQIQFMKRTYEEWDLKAKSDTTSIVSSLIAQDWFAKWKNEELTLAQYQSQLLALATERQKPKPLQK